MNVYEDGILVGWQDAIYNNEGKKLNVFIPRREEDIEEDIRIAYESN